MRVSRIIALSCWGFLAWAWLTWMVSLEVYVVGAGIAVGSALLLAPLGDVVPPWRVLAPRRLTALARLVGRTLWHVSGANVDLARRIWTPSLPITPGVVIVPTRMTGDAGLTTMGVLTSLVVDNQVIDLNPSASTALFHRIEVPGDTVDERRAAINGPTEQAIARVGAT